MLLAGAGPVRSQGAGTEAAPAAVLLPVEIVRAAPLPGVGQPRDRIPANVQVLDRRRQQALDTLNLPELMSWAAGSVSTAQIQGNPYQVEANFRGFSAGPLLGTPQGLSVFLDGVRVNEPFGDIVHWDLIPRQALRTLTLMPGSNPVWGLNTLGGALVLSTRSGATDPGTEVEWNGGARCRVSAELAHGRSWDDGRHLFLAATAAREDGWRDASPSRVRQLFGQFGRQQADLDWRVGLTLADNRVVGNGVLPDTLWAQRAEQVYTQPDETRNRLAMGVLNIDQVLSATDRLHTTLALRSLQTDTLNGDVNDAFDPPLVTEGGVENRTDTRQRSHSLALQWSRTRSDRQWIVGVSHDASRSEFRQTEAEGELDGARRVSATEDAEVNAALVGRTRTDSVYAAHTRALRPNLHLSLSGRYNRTRVSTVDVGRTDLGLATALDNDLRFRRLNPALGLTWQVRPTLTTFASLSQGNRAPSPIELGCSDPAQPCVLPNALQSDPPLRQVVSRTLEAGLRGSTAGGLRWNAGVFRTRNRDDILFISNSLAAGYFSNFGQTQRQGLELGGSGRHGAFDWTFSLTRLRATFESGACLVAEANRSAETSAAGPGDDEIEVRPGDRLPGLPQSQFKLDGGRQLRPDLRLGAGLVAQSAVLRGHENNRHGEGGRVAGFAVLNLQAAWQLAPRWSLSGKISNLADRRYATGGMLAQNAFDANGVLQAPAPWTAERFVAPGAPRAAWLGLTYRIGADGG